MLYQYKFITITILLSLILMNCSQKVYDITDFEKMSIFEYLNQPDEKLNIEMAALILSKEIFPEIKFQEYTRIIDNISYRVQLYVKDKIDPRYKIASINTVLYKEYGVEFDKKDFLWRDYHNQFFSSALTRKKGVCTTLPLIYMVVSERLRYPVYAVAAPAHTFCRFVFTDDAGKEQYINIEATSGGGEVPDVCYIEDMQIPKKAFKNGVYLRTLSKREYIGSLLHNNGAYYLMKGNIDKAIKYFEESTKLNPRNSYTHYVLGICYKKMCNSLDTPEERKPYYFKALKQDEIVDNLGIAPPCPEDYWKQSFTEDLQHKNEQNIEIRKGADGIIYAEDTSYRKKIKMLEAKYYDYFH